MTIIKTIGKSTKRLVGMGMSLSMAELVSFWGNWVLVATLLLGVGATYAVIISGNVKEAALKKELTKASDDAENAKRQTAKLEKQTADSNERIRRLDLSVAEANARAAEASKSAEQDRLARVKIEQRLAPRSISLEQAHAFIASISEFGGVKIAVFIASPSPETATFAADLRKMLILAGWLSEQWTMTGVTGVLGVHVILKADATSRAQNAAAALHLALDHAQVANALESWPADWSHFGGMLSGPPFDPEDAEIRLIVCDKPIESSP